MTIANVAEVISLLLAVFHTCTLRENGICICHPAAAVELLQLVWYLTVYYRNIP